MSPAAAQQLESVHPHRKSSQSTRHVCRGCSIRRARFRRRGEVRADKDHDLCFRCFRGARERLRARLLREVRQAAPLKMDLARPRPARGRAV